MDVRNLPLEWLRSHMGLVSQEPVLFACSLRDNILYGRPGSSQEELEAAAKAAFAHDFITSFPDGYAIFSAQPENDTMKYPMRSACRPTFNPGLSCLNLETLGVHDRVKWSTFVVVASWLGRSVQTLNTKPSLTYAEVFRPSI